MSAIAGIWIVTIVVTVTCDDSMGSQSRRKLEGTNLSQDLDESMRAVSIAFFNCAAQSI